MKKQLTIILTATVFSLLLSSCGSHGGSGNKPKPTLPSSTTYETVSVRTPSHDLSKVDVMETFDDYYVPDYDEPWGATQHLNMANGDVDNFFCYYTLDYNGNQVNENLNYVSTISRPMIIEYPADEDGYVIYEVTYTQTFPICTKEPTSAYNSFFSYHGVGFVDFYSGTKFPVVNLSTQIDSYGVTGNYIQNGKKFHISCYEFRETEVLDSYATDAGDGMVIREEYIKLTQTSYFIVPEGYDGILMYVYVADDTDTPLEKVLEDNTPYFVGPTLFGIDENPDDHVFFGINAPR
ncbi:hypothetical protein [Butyrivibrio sp. AE2032]|uniref:hypothetical protein n=1 Tax=Butyrivibrio sp. AE2032 TaxID=1458463 RepID=UPI00054ECB0A|nr:hypothetical protein [Butyrivibrio sp. AE2032]